MTPQQIIAQAFAEHHVTYSYVGLSGGDDSMVAAHWMMTNVPGCRVLHINTGIGIERTRQFVREFCAARQWPLTEIHAKHDCGQDYDAMVLEHGFPGPPQHKKMYSRLKERCVEKLIRDVKEKRFDRVLIATGVYQEESQRRSGYGDRVINRKGAQLWVNPFYFWTKAEFVAYREAHSLPRNPVSEMLGMSGECLCGAFAHKGEKALIRLVCPSTADRIDALERQVKAQGFAWGWEDRPPKKVKSAAGVPGPLCMGCEK